MVRRSANGGAYEDENEGANPRHSDPPLWEKAEKRDLPPSQPSNPFEEEPEVGHPRLRGDVIMADLSREEIDAKLEAAEARTEARFAQLTRTLDVRFVNLDTKIDRLIDSVGRLSSEVTRVQTDNKATRWTIITVVVASVLAGLAAIWVTQGNMLAAFQASLAVKTIQSEAPKR